MPSELLRDRSHDGENGRSVSVPRWAIRVAVGFFYISIVAAISTTFVVLGSIFVMVNQAAVIKRLQEKNNATMKRIEKQIESQR